MPVDKFGRNDDRTTPVYTGINISNLTNSFLRRDGGNTAIGTIDMNSNIIKNVSDPLSNQDVATKNYVDRIAFTRAGGTVFCPILLNVSFYNPTVFLGCLTLDIGKEFLLLLGSDQNTLSYTRLNSGVPVMLNTTEGFVVSIRSHPICGFSQDLILCSQPIDMNQHLIKNVKSPVNKLDAVNKAYADRIKYKSATGTIPNTVMTNHTLFPFPATKDIISGKIILCKMWVERLVGELISTSSPMFATEWPGFHRFSRGPSIMTFFSGSPASGWTRNFRVDYIELP